MVFTLLFPDFYPECRAILPGFRPDSGVVCLADALCNRQPQPGSAAGVGWVRAVKALKNMGQPVRWDGRAGAVPRQTRLAARCGQPQGHGAAGARVAYLMALSSRITANRCREAASPCTVWPGFVLYNQDIHRQISFGFLQFIDTVYHNQLKIG